jgi:hypothetical protein
MKKFSHDSWWTPDPVLHPPYITANFGLIPQPEDGGSIFFRNIGNDLPDRTASRSVTQ